MERIFPGCEMWIFSILHMPGQLLGKYYKTERDRIEGLNILDIYTEWQPGKLRVGRRPL